MPEKKPQKKGPGGIPRNTWLIGGAAVGLIAYLLYKRSQASKAAAQAAGISTLPSGMPAGAQSGSTDLTPKAPTYNSLQDWMSHVQGWANSLGFDAASVQNALQAYSLGNCVDATGYKIIDQALGLFGQPPGAPYKGVVLCQPSKAPPTPTATNAFDLSSQVQITPEGYGFKSTPAVAKYGWGARLVTDAGTFLQLPGATLPSYFGSGGEAYYQPVPGVFRPVPKGTLPASPRGPNNPLGLLPNTPIFTKVA